MKKFTLGFTAGLSFVLILFSAYVGYLLQVARPAYEVSWTPIELTKERKQEIYSALTKLSAITNVAGLDRYSSLFLGSAAVIGQDLEMSPMITKYTLMKSVEIAKKYGNESGEFNPYFESSFTLALILKDYGENEAAKKVVKDALLVASAKQPESYWVNNLLKLKFN